ncbi:hypothetical protein C0993_000753 [Termitomyces sp. T159_Od127]|nr:hypothetical protein C0993_000753 [Termitomyces sp. T159_Od127]
MDGRYFPTGFVLPNDTGIPFYAGTDPTTWPEQRFDSQQAQKIVDQGHHDLFPSSQQQKSSRPVGAIVGGVIGGLAVIAVAVVLATCLYMKRQKRIRSSKTDTDGSKHARKMSDLSQKSGIGYGYQQLERSFATSPTSQPPLSPTTGTMHTHTASANSLSYFGSVRHSVMPYGTSTSPPPATQPVPSSSHPPNIQGLGREGIIVPFTLPPSDMTSLQGSSTNLSDRKRADGAIIPVYDPPNSLPYNVAPALSETSTTRARVNPPAYSAVDQASIAPTRTHEKKESNDTQFSTDSKTGSGAQNHIGAGGGSISTTIEEVIGQMGISGQESVSAGGTLSTGQSGQLPGARPFVPVLGNPDP